MGVQSVSDRDSLRDALLAAVSAGVDSADAVALGVLDGSVVTRHIVDAEVASTLLRQRSPAIAADDKRASTARAEVVVSDVQLCLLHPVVMFDAAALIDEQHAHMGQWAAALNTVSKLLANQVSAVRVVCFLSGASCDSDPLRLQNKTVKAELLCGVPSALCGFDVTTTVLTASRRVVAPGSLVSILQARHTPSPQLSEAVSALLTELLLTAVDAAPAVCEAVAAQHGDVDDARVQVSVSVMFHLMCASTVI